MTTSNRSVRLQTKHGGHKNGRKGGLSGSSFFTWFMVIALLGVWTSVAVVWFELVDYEEVLAKAKDFRYNLSEVLQGKLGVYDADGDGDFDVDDAQVLLEGSSGVVKKKSKAKVKELTKEELKKPREKAESRKESKSEERRKRRKEKEAGQKEKQSPDSQLPIRGPAKGEKDEGKGRAGLHGSGKAKERGRNLSSKEKMASKMMTRNKEDGKEGRSHKHAHSAKGETQKRARLKESSASEPAAPGEQLEPEAAGEQVHPGTGEDIHQEEDEPARDQQLADEDFLTGSDIDDKFESQNLEAETFHEETVDSYHVEEPAPQDYVQDMEEVIYEQESPDSSVPVVDDERLHHDTDDVMHQVYDEQENDVEESHIILEEVSMPPAEEQHEGPSETNGKTGDPEPKEKVKKKKPKLLNKFDKTIKAELDAAEKLRKRGKIEEALKAFEELVRKYPHSPRARYGKAQCEDDLAEKKKSNEVLRGAIETYQEVVSLLDVPPDLVKLSLKRRSDRQQFLGHMRGSLLTLQRLVQLFPSDTSLKNDLGVGYLLMGDNDSAKKVYEEVLTVTPSDGFAKVHYGFILKAQNKIAESIPYLKEGIESGAPGTDDGRFYFHLGDAMQRVGDKEAYRWYELGHKRGHFASVWQRSLYNVKDLKAQPWWTAKETGYTELVKSLERNWKLIRDEGLAVMDKARGLFLPEDENLREKGDWSQFTLWQQGRKNEKACKGAPRTCALLEKFPETTGCRRGQIKYSVMHPGTHVWPHTGPTNCRLRMHLGLVIPKEGCRIRCAGETKTWEEGRVLIFDDSFEHEVWQDASSFRLIFIVDVWHPELTPQQRRTLPAI
ncbi:PREDICTED: aspartyl/asparaginyl beta-hydroxylase-like [Elephantulus edwardii]|uniref:aspartyl/asparaginyl beta-hydroxylase-like n=1 Tax=Elephantulus edwardii TaxID=28737 RepID=UPI0003F0724B|nr:PREDICTED: aspartyl/asparaginyl beta-hydroxylase-like [Elephantulus edwardii]